MIYVCGRKVKVLSGKKSQTVNICSKDNIHGEYDYIAILPPLRSGWLRSERK